MDPPRVTPTASVTFWFVGLKCSQPCYSEPDSNQIQFAWVFLGVTTPRRMACGWLESRLMAFFLQSQELRLMGIPSPWLAQTPPLAKGGNASKAPWRFSPKFEGLYLQQ